MKKGILKGLRILEGSAFVAAPLGGMTLAQLGADVIRFDPIGGGLDYRRWPVTKEGASLFWAGMNKGKRSFQVDIGHPRGRELITSLLAGNSLADGIFLTNFPERGWLAYEKLRATRDDLIYVNIMGDRLGGSALDYTVNCAVGFATLTGSQNNDDPTNYLLPAWDNITGQMAAIAVLAAERHRRLEREGQLVKLALKDVAIATTSNLGNISEVTINGEDRKKYGNYLYGAFGRDFETKDKKRLMIVGLTPRQWSSILVATDSKDEIVALEASMSLDFSKEGDRFKAKEAIAKILEPWFKSRVYEEVCAFLDEHGVCYGPYRTFKEMVEKDVDCSIDNPMMGLINQPEIGSYIASGSPIRFSESENLAALPAPVLGEHTEEILKDDLGLGDSEVGDLFKQGIVAW